MSTRQRVRNFCITANFKENEDEIKEFLALEDNAKQLWPQNISNFIVFQLEKGKEGTTHIQAYIELKTAMEFKPFIKKMNDAHEHWAGCHIEQCKLEKASMAYCIKQDTRIMGPWKFGTPKEAGKRNDLIEIADSIKENGLKQTIREHPDAYIKYNRGMEKLAEFYADENAGYEVPNVHILFGDGGTGKTKTVYDKYKNTDIARAMYQKDGDTYKVWFQNYMYQPCILFEEFTDIKCPIDLLKMYTDGYPCDMNIKGSSKTRYNCKDIYILSNKDPRTWYSGATDVDKAALRRRITSVTKFEINKEPISLPINDIF